jgi:hypothetical protein
LKIVELDMISISYISNARSIELQQLFKYVKKEISNYFYYTIINKYPALGCIIEVVKANGLENWIG